MAFKMEKFNIFFRGIQQGFKNFGRTVTNIVNFFLLLIVYVFGIGLVSIISKLTGKHYLDLKKSGNKTNWHEHRVAKQPLEKYFRSF